MSLLDFECAQSQVRRTFLSTKLRKRKGLVEIQPENVDLANTPFISKIDHEILIQISGNKILALPLGNQFSNFKTFLIYEVTLNIVQIKLSNKTARNTHLFMLNCITKTFFKFWPWIFFLGTSVPKMSFMKCNIWNPIFRY